MYLVWYWQDGCLKVSVPVNAEHAWSIVMSFMDTRWSPCYYPYLEYIAVPKRSYMTKETETKCEEPGCTKEAMTCHLIDYGDFKSEGKDVYSYLCPEHARRAGFCPGCGEFWSGITEFDLSGLCPHCQDEVDADSGPVDDDYIDFLV